MYVKVTVTAEDGETASDVTTEPVEPFGIIEIESAEATAVNEINVLLAYSIDPEDTVVELTKGNAAVPFTVAWDEDYDVATITTAAKMINGVYTVTISSIDDPDNEDSAEVEIKDQYVEKIEILNDVALTNTDKSIAYAYYDVYDQYGNSVRPSTSIQWAGSCVITPNKTNGQLKLEKVAAGDDWTYGEQIYITGVYTKTGVSESATLTVGTEQNLDKIDMVGFVKKGTSTIIPAKEGLPKDFKSGEYYLLFNALDQNGNALAATGIDKDDVTFVSDNVLVVKELTKFYNDGKSGLTIEGTEYCAVEVTPGIKVADGGEVTVTAIATKTGNKTDVNFEVGEDAVVASFTMDQPEGIVADGDEGVEIPFTAIDQHGNTITNFRTLAKQKTFNTLSFNASEGELVLAEQDNGTAKLTWSDDPMSWADGKSTDGIDRPISLTAIVVGGETENEMISVSDKRRPDAVADVDMDSVYVEGATIAFENTESFAFYDQYGELMGDFGADNDFFDAAAAKVLKGTEFQGYDFGVRIKNAGSGKIDYLGGNTAILTTTTNEFVVTGNATEDTVTFATDIDIQSAATGEGFKFEIAKWKRTDSTPTRTAAKDWESVSTSKYMPVTVVDITQVKNLEVGALNTFYVGKLDVTGDGIIKTGTALGDEPLKVTSAHTAGEQGIYDADSDYYQTVKVSGTYNGETVNIPAIYFNITANKLIDTTGDNAFDQILAYDDTSAETKEATKNALQAADLYDKSSAKCVAKLATDEVTATVYKVYTDDYFFWEWNAGAKTLERNVLAEDATADEIAAAKTTADATFTVPATETDRAAAIQTAMVNAAKAIDVTITDGDKLDVLLAGTYATDPADLTLADAGTAKTTADAAVTTKKAELNGLGTGTTLSDKADELTVTATTTTTDINAFVSSNAATFDTDLKVTAATNYLNAKLDQAKAVKNVEQATKRDAKEAAEEAGANLEAEYALQLLALADNEENKATGVKGAPGGKYDTAKATITLSDQKPKATAITGLDETYTFNPKDTKVANAAIKTELEDVEVVDQYGVEFSDALVFTVKDITESATGYASNNFKVANNASATASLDGAELGDTFTLEVSFGEIKETTSVTVGADEYACISSERGNLYKDKLEPTLETQRLAGLG